MLLQVDDELLLETSRPEKAQTGTRRISVRRSAVCDWHSSQILQLLILARPRPCGREKDDEVESAKWREEQKRDGPQLRMIGKGVTAPEKKRSCREKR
jgi:hypothetical protein